jgi:formamidopyrimidine-DNA glycosylase
MPELPEVETVRRSLQRHLPGQRLASVDVLHQKTIRADASFAERLAGLTFERVDRIAKLLIFRFVETPDVLVVHLKMTGQFLYRHGRTVAGGGHSQSDAPVTWPNQHTRLVFHLEHGGTLFFNDMRLFAFAKRLTPVELREVAAAYGIEPGTPSYTAEAFSSLLLKRQAPLKAVLLDQSRIAGLGNIYVDEACYLAGVRPTKRAATLTAAQRERLFVACEEVLSESVALGGTTFRSYSDADGRSGGYLEKLRVYGRAGLPCLRCGGAHQIQKVVCAGRGTHYCAHCQVS